MVASVNSARVGEAEVLKKIGLSDHHAYTVLHAVTVLTRDKKPIHLVKIRNPYGFGSLREHEIDWDKIDLEDREQTYKRYGVDNELDGIFWMRFRDFVRYFYCTSVSLY